MNEAVEQQAIAVGDDVADVPGNLEAPPAIVAKSGKSKEEIYLELAKLAQQSFENRRSYEWKVAFGLWTGIAAFTYFSVEHLGPLSASAQLGLLIAYIIIGILWCAVWQPSLRAAFDRDKDWKHYYLHRAENRPEDKCDPDPWLTKKSGRRHETLREICDAWKQPWTWSQAGVTIVFLALSWSLVCCANPAPPKQDGNDRISVSGGNATKVLDKLIK